MPLPQIPQNISDEIFHILTKEDNAALIDRIATEHDVSEDDIFKLSAVIGHAIMGTVTLDTLADMLKEELVVDSEKAKKIALAILLTVLYPYWPLFPDIDNTITVLGGKVPTEKPAMPRPPQEENTPVAYPEISPTAEEKPELLGGWEIPAPPAPRMQNNEVRSMNYGVTERDMPWQPQINTPPQTPPYQGGGERRNVARPGDVAKLLEKNLIQPEDKDRDLDSRLRGNDTGGDPRVKGNVVDLSQ